MSAYLLDANVLIALIDPAHLQHNSAHRWLASVEGAVWATCPTTENAVLRIVGSARYPNSPGNPARVVDSLRSLLALPGHEFWADHISLLDIALVDPARLLDSTQISDSYLLALAIAHGGMLATFDRRLVTSAVVGGAKALHLID